MVEIGFRLFARGLSALRFFLGESATVMTGLLGSSGDLCLSRTGLFYCQSLGTMDRGRAFLRLRDRVGGLTRLEDTWSTTMCGTSQNHSKALGLDQWACRYVMPVKQASNMHFKSTDPVYTSIKSCSLHRYKTTQGRILTMTVNFPISRSLPCPCGYGVIFDFT